MSGAAVAGFGAARVQVADGTVLVSSTTSGSSSYTFGNDAPNFAWLEGWGGGGGGNSSGGKSPIFYGGAGAGYFKHKITAYPGLTVSFAIGAGGALGVAGSATTVSALSLSAGGGGAASTSAASSSPGTGSGGNLSNQTGNSGGSPNTWTGGGAANGGGDQNTSLNAGTSPGGGGSAAAGADGQFKITAKAT